MAKLDGTGSVQTDTVKSNVDQGIARPAEQATPKVQKEMISQHQIRVNKLKRDVESVIDTMDKAGVKPFQDKKVINKYRQSLSLFKRSISKYSEFSMHPTVIAANGAITKMEQMITFGQQQAAKDLAVLGDVQSRLRVIHQTTRNLKLPAAPTIPFKKGQLAQWLTELGNVRQVAIKTLQPLPQIKKLAYLPDTRFTVQATGIYEMGDVDRLDRSLSDMVESVDNGLKKFSTYLDLNVKNIDKKLTLYQSYDPSNDEDRLQHFLYEGRAEQIKNSLARERLLVSEAIEFSRRLKTNDLNDRVNLLKRIEDTKSIYLANFEKALKQARMPKAVSTDSKLLEFARKAMEMSGKRGYDKTGDIKRMVITSKKVHRANDVSNHTFDKMDVNTSGNITMSGTSITSHFEWDEFKVATAEEVGSKHYIYYNSFAFYTEGGRKTVLNRWIITGRLKGAEIPETNINKD
ncbi:MAG: hypothetical protein GY941_16615 [Planctomycetes bacterium]|nr:hypothetical protein [Planctomycetota bacterium]